MNAYRSIFAVALLLTFQAAAAFGADITLDLAGIAPSEAKTAPPQPKQPETRSVELHPDDNLIIRFPTKKYPGDKGWIEYRSSLSGPGCMISTMTREAHSEAFQATKVGSQKIIVGLKEPGSSQLQKDCVVTVKVTAPIAGQDNRGSSPNVQSYAGQTVFGNKTSAVTNSTVKTVSGGDKNQSTQGNQAKPTVHSVEDLSKATVKSY